MRKLLAMREKGKLIVKDIEVFSEPSALTPVTSPLAWKILIKLNERPYFPRELALELGADEQKIYYHIHALQRAGLIEVVKEEQKRGGVCKYYVAKCAAFGVELEGKYSKYSLTENDLVKSFFSEFVRNGFFDGLIVVGAPNAHGPYLTSARDGHLVAPLAMLLGSFCELSGFIVKTDIECKAEKALTKNLILIGGPVTNIISDEVNKNLKIKFVWDKLWCIRSELTKKSYSDDDYGVIAKIRNPWESSKVVVMLAGLTLEGTRATIISMIQHSKKLLKDYKGKDFVALIKGLDKDGDGKVDNVSILETWTGD